jgi:hypothetical protein
MKKLLKKNGGIVLLVVAILIRLIFSISNGLFESVYFKGLFPVIRKVQYWLGEHLPLPGYYLLFIAVLAWLFWRFPKKQTFENWKRFFQRVLNFAGFWAALFLVLWGYNYVGPTLAERLELSENSTAYDAVRVYQHAMHSASEKRNPIALPTDTSSVDELDVEIDYEAINASVQRALGEMGYPVAEKVCLKRIKPPGTLRRLGIRGIYNPFTGEANFESDAGTITSTFTSAHEMAHAYGITSEGEANFVAFLALSSSENEIWEYAAYFTLWRYTAKEVNDQLDGEQLTALAESIPIGLQIDRRAIWRRAAANPALFPELSEAMNDTYLKVQGVEMGVEDYNGFVSLYLRFFKPVMD